MRRIGILFLSILVPINISFAGPFGLEKGTQLPAFIGIRKTELAQFYVLSSVPKPHPAFTVFRVRIGARAGLCAIIAGTKPFENDSDGAQARGKFETIKQQLTAIYGPPSDLQFLRAGAISKEPSQFVASLANNERVYSSFWTKETGARMKDGLVWVSLEIGGDDKNSSMVVLRYHFDNIEECESEGLDSL